MTKLMISILLAFTVGLFSSRFILPAANKKDAKDLSVNCENLTDAKSSLISISQNEYLEYTKIKDLKQKYEKADELLGKVMILFLADVGFRLQKPGMVEPGVETPSATTIKPEVINHVVEMPIVAPAPTVDSGLRGKSSAIKTLTTEKQIDEVLDKSIIANPKAENAKGMVINSQQARILDGRYAGSIKFLDSKRESLSVIWDLAPDYSKSELSVTFTLSIHGTSTNSDSNGSGSIDKIVNLADDKGGYLVSSCGGACYLQLYYNSAGDRFFGNYYEEGKKSSSFTRVGIVELKK